MSDKGQNIFIKAPTENEVLTRIEAVADTAIRNALLGLFYWRLANQAAVRSGSTEKSS